MRFNFSPHNPTLNSKRSWNFVFTNSKPPTYLEFIFLLEGEIENKCACFCTLYMYDYKMQYYFEVSFQKDLLK